MEVTVFYLSILQKLQNYINSKQNQSKEIKGYRLCLGNVSKNVTMNNMKKTGLKGVVNFFSVEFNPTDNNDIINIQKYLMGRT